jgi:D-alanyl-D-alanine carboxypeptidase/D-alanyl-D-alanine-endopeptidase (penicillin-binding protein 4)
MVPDIGYPALRVSAVTVQRPDTLPCCDTTSVARRPEPRELTAEHDSSSSSGVIIDGEIAVGDSAVLDVAYRDAATAFMLALRKALAERAITIEGGVDPRVRRDTGQRLDTILTLRSPPLREILPAFQKPSQNQIGEILYKTLGLVRTGVGTADSGRVVVERQLAAWGIDSSMFAVRDGSGLSRHDYVSPEALVRVLDVMRRHPSFAVFYDALPVAGVDGTIARRMRGTAAAGNVRAKTGTLDKARSLSGYVRTDDGRMLIFSLLCNNFTTPVADVTEVQDAIATRLALLRGRR